MIKFDIAFRIHLIWKDVLDSKNGAIKDLQYELARVCKAHNDLLRTYEAKLAQYGIPVEEMGFKPLESSIGGAQQQLGKGASGLVSAPNWNRFFFNFVITFFYSNIQSF